MKTTREQAKKEFFKHCKFLELGPGEETYLWEGVRKLLEKERLAGAVEARDVLAGGLKHLAEALLAIKPENTKGKQ